MHFVQTLENNPKKLRALIGCKSCFYNSMETHWEVARAVDVMMALAKRMYILIIKLFSLTSSRCFLKEIGNMFSVFLSSYRNTRERLGYSNGNLKTCENNMLFSRVKISCLRAKTHLVFRLTLFNIIINKRGQIENRPLQNTRSAGRKRLTAGC